MKKSELIAKLQKEVNTLGDDYLMSYKVVDSGGGQEFFRLSPSRWSKNGLRSRMNFKEFRDYVLDERTKETRK